jgi:signal transduction histidine kinase
MPPAPVSAPDADVPPEALRRLLEVSAALNTIRDPDALLAYIIDTATEVMHCGAASLLLFDETEGRLRFAAATGEQAAALADIPVPLHGSIAGTIYAENRTVRADDTRSDERHYGAVDEAVGTHTEALLGVPLRLGERPIGVFEVLNPAAGRFTDADEATLTVLAAQAAVAIENVRQRRALADARDRLAGLDRLKSEFMALASHELRTPITIILGYADILDGEAPEGLREFVGTIQQAGRRLREIVETLEEVSTLKSGDADLTLLPTTLEAVVQKAWSVESMDESPLQTTLDLPDAPLDLLADPVRLRLVFAHLLRNAKTFSKAGGEVRVRLYADGPHACAEVHDDGAGLSEADCTRAFEPFYQVQNHLDRDHEGMGTGLTVAQALVHAHGGRIWAESDGVGCGATFHVRLPLAREKADES